jgi:hypothetical protein
MAGLSPGHLHFCASARRKRKYFPNAHGNTARFVTFRAGRACNIRLTAVIKKQG